MPFKALVAFGVAFGMGLLSLSPSAWCSDANIAHEVNNLSSNNLPQTAIDQSNLQTVIPLSLEAALQRTIQQHPKLAASSLEVEAREFEVRQAGFYPNPELSIEVENFAGSGDFSGTDRAETTAQISQRLEIGGKRTQRLAVHRQMKRLAEQDYAVAQADLIAETTNRFLAVLAAQKQVALAEEQTELAARVLETVNKRIDSGKTAKIERLRFQSLVTEARLRADRAQHQLTATRYSLAALWDQIDTVDFTAVQGDIEALPDVPEWSDLLSMLPQSPTFNSQAAEIRMAEHNLDLEQAKSIPDLILSFGAKSIEETDDNALVAGIAISLPIFDRNQGAISAARMRQTEAKNSARAAQLGLHSELNEIWQKLQVARREAVMLRDEQLPAVQQSFEAISYGYQAGKYGFLEVLDAEQTLFETKNRYVVSLTNYLQTYTELERLLGQRLSPEKNESFLSATKTRGQS